MLGSSVLRTLIEPIVDPLSKKPPLTRPIVFPPVPVLQVRGRLHRGAAAGRRQAGPGPEPGGRVPAQRLPLHRAEGAAPERATVPAALPRLLPLPPLPGALQPLRGAGRGRLLRLADHPGPGRDTPPAPRRG